MIFADLPAGTTSFDDNEVTVTVHYVYYVVAFNGYAESVHSNEVEVVVGS